MHLFLWQLPLAHHEDVRYADRARVINEQIITLFRRLGSACHADSRNRTAPELTEPLISLPCRESEERKERRLGDESPECREPMNRSYERINDLCMAVESPEVREPTQEGLPAPRRLLQVGGAEGRTASAPREARASPRPKATACPVEAERRRL